MCGHIFGCWGTRSGSEVEIFHQNGRWGDPVKRPLEWALLMIHCSYSWLYEFNVFGNFGFYTASLYLNAYKKHGFVKMFAKMLVLSLWVNLFIIFSLQLKDSLLSYYYLFQIYIYIYVHIYAWHMVMYHHFRSGILQTLINDLLKF